MHHKRSPVVHSAASAPPAPRVGTWQGARRRPLGSLTGDLLRGARLLLLVLHAVTESKWLNLSGRNDGLPRHMLSAEVTGSLREQIAAGRCGTAGIFRAGLSDVTTALVAGKERERGCFFFLLSSAACSVKVPAV